jgi:hypothetical protein
MLAVEQQGEDVAAGIYAKIVFTATIAGQMYTLDGVHDIGANAPNGTHTVTWMPPADIRAKATECTMTATLSATDNPSGDDYIVVELFGENNGRISYTIQLNTRRRNWSCARFRNGWIKVHCPMRMFFHQWRAIPLATAAIAMFRKTRRRN